MPAKNEADNIVDILTRCLAITDSVIVVDGHSVDETRSIAEKLGAKTVKGIPHDLLEADNDEEEES